jgi:hypothetical protein
MRQDAANGQWYARGYRNDRGGIIAPAKGYSPHAFGLKPCEKSAPTTSSHTPGIMTGCCPHGFVYFLSFMRAAEGPREVYNFLRYRCAVLPRLVIYDNACNTMRYIAMRSLYIAGRVRFMVDRLHWANHVHCSTAFRLFEYGQYSLTLRNLNSQIMEQLNNLLRRLAPHFSHSTPYNAVRSLLLFLKFQGRQRLRSKGLPFLSAADIAAGSAVPAAVATARVTEEDKPKEVEEEEIIDLPEEEEEVEEEE